MQAQEKHFQQTFIKFALLLELIFFSFLKSYIKNESILCLFQYSYSEIRDLHVCSVMPSRGTQASSLEPCCVWAGSSASAAVLLPMPRQIWLLLCSLGVVYGLWERPFNWYHTQHCRALPQTSHTEMMMMGPKARSSGLRWLLDF